ncbi:MAG: hypothetical protein QXM68_00690 [Candidatus Aenigmatarchaeota archaeon]|nr:hypothetical protein [Candidatus Aenigmarchaeota archaeon]
MGFAFVTDKIILSPKNQPFAMYNIVKINANVKIIIEPAKLKIKEIMYIEKISEQKIKKTKNKDLLLFLLISS